MEDANGIAQWNASGSRKNSIVAAGSSVEQLEAGAGADGGMCGRVPERECGIGRRERTPDGYIPLVDLFDC